MKNNRSIKRRGFTLVELLIVIVVIGILSAMMMLSSTEAVSSARANNIISNLRNLKTSALAWYVDSMDKIDKDYSSNFTGITPMDYVKKYLSNGAASDLSDYGLEIKNISNTNRWVIYYEKSKADANVRLKLKSRAASVGLLKGTNYTSEYDGADERVGLLVR